MYPHRRERVGSCRSREITRSAASPARSVGCRRFRPRRKQRGPGGSSSAEGEIEGAWRGCKCRDVVEIRAARGGGAVRLSGSSAGGASRRGGLADRLRSVTQPPLTPSSRKLEKPLLIKGFRPRLSPTPLPPHLPRPSRGRGIGLC